MAIRPICWATAPFRPVTYLATLDAVQFVPTSSRTQVGKAPAPAAVLVRRAIRILHAASGCQAPAGPTRALVSTRGRVRVPARQSVGAVCVAPAREGWVTRVPFTGYTGPRGSRRDAHASLVRRTVRVSQAASVWQPAVGGPVCAGSRIVHGVRPQCGIRRPVRHRLVRHGLLAHCVRGPVCHVVIPLRVEPGIVERDILGIRAGRCRAGRVQRQQCDGCLHG